MNTILHALIASWPWTTVDVLNHLWQSTVVGLAVLAVLTFGRRLSARTRRTLAWMALIKFVLPASFFAGVLARLGAKPGNWVESGALTGPLVLPTLAVTAPAGDAAAHVSIGLIAMSVWIVGFAWLFVSWFVRGQRLRRQIFGEMQTVSEMTAARMRAAARRAGLTQTPPCFAVGSERAPGVLGALAPIVILPCGLEAALTPAELESVLIHECVHVQRRDNLWGAGQAFFASLFWFHPVVWWLNRQLVLETEQACDERVLEITGDPDTYAGGIVKAVQHALGVVQPGLLGATTPPVIARIKNIFAHGARRDRPLVRGAVLAGGTLLLAFSGCTGSFAGASPAPVPESKVPAAVVTPSPAAKKSEETLSIDFPNEDVRNIILNVANLFELKVVMPDTLKGKTTIKLNAVTWRQIFTAVLEPLGYTFVEGDNVIRIIPARTGAGAAAPPGTSSPERSITLVAEDTVFVRVTHLIGEDTDGEEIFKGTLTRGQTQIVPWTTPINIWTNAGENLVVDYKGQRFPLKSYFTGYGHAQMKLP